MYKYNLIPAHKSCKNCGGCCGPVPIDKDERRAIQRYVDKHKPKYNNEDPIMLCKFRVDGGCSIYEVRPTLCRLMGVTKDLHCTFGNTHKIDGQKFINLDDEDQAGFIFDVIKTDY